MPPTLHAMPLVAGRPWRFVWALFVLAGCRAWTVGQPLHEALHPPAPAPAVEGLREDRWSLDTTWTPAAAAEATRWRLLPLAVESDLTSASTEAGAATLTTAASADDELSRLEVLARRDDLVGWNAAILRAQQDPGSAADLAPVLERLVTAAPAYDVKTLRRTDAAAGANPLEQLVQRLAKERRTDEETEGTARRVSEALRAAAAEAWCLVLARQAGDPFVALAPAGRLLDREDLSAEVRGELFRGIARGVAPALIPGLDGALAEGGPAEVRRAAMDACVIHAILHPHSASDELWPEVLWSETGDSPLALDPDAVLRCRYGQWLAATKHPAALDVLTSQIQDRDDTVCNSALVSLGVLGSDEARAELERQSRRSEEQVRLHAARGLALWGAGALAPLAHDASYRVREAVAEGLGRCPSVEAGLLLREFLTDPNLQVQAAAVRAVESWTDPLAAPLLLHGLRQGAFKTRVACLRCWQERTRLSVEFPLSGTPEEREEAAARLALAAGLPSSYLGELSRRSRAPEPARPAPAAANDLTADLRTVTEGRFATGSAEYRAALERLLALRTQDLPAVERFAMSVPGGCPAVLLREVLPRLSPVYAALSDLQQPDVFVRRRGAQVLADVGVEESLSPLAARELVARMVHEQDGLVWRYALAAVLHDGTEESARLAALAAHSPFADVRRLACDFAARHRRPQDAVWLLPLFGDSDREVRLAAIRAAGSCPVRTLIDGVQGADGTRLPGLRSLLSDSDAEIRFAAAVGMSRLGDSAGVDELIRLSYEPEAGFRQRVVRAMGTTSQSRFVDHLIRMAWTERHDEVRAAILDSLNQLVLPENRPPGLATASGDDAKIRIWIEWVARDTATL